MRFTLVLLASSLLGATLPGSGPAPLERQRLIAHFDMTNSWLADEVSHLSENQLNFRPAPGVWSVLDCVTHLDLSEAGYWAMLKKVMAMPASRKLSPSPDIDRLWYGIDRTQRTKTVPAETPKGQFKELGPALASFQARRAEMMDYIKTSNDDWRHHLVPEWDRDAYQWLLMISAHSQRHILQIREIKHDPNFPQS